MRCFDYYENTGEPISHYVQVIRDKERELKFQHGVAVLPHDARQRMLETGKNRQQTIESLGLKAEITPDHRVDDGIEAVRRMLPNCWFDDTRAEYGIDCLRMYRSEFDEKNNVLKPRPVHDWTSHGADAFRAGAMYQPRNHQWEPLKYDNRGII